jgi:hypothetical protein
MSVEKRGFPAIAARRIKVDHPSLPITLVIDRTTDFRPNNLALSAW